MIRRLEDIPAEIRRMDAAGLRQGRNWSLAQIVEHLALTIDWVTGRMPHGEFEFSRGMWKQRFARLMVFATGRLPENVRTSERVVAPPSTTLDAAISHLERAIAEFQSARQLAPRHPVLGPLSRSGWLRFHLIHARHHLRQVEKKVSG